MSILSNLFKFFGFSNKRQSTEADVLKPSDDLDYEELTTKQLTNLANVGDAVAQSHLGLRYQCGGDDVNQDNSKAIYWFEQAAKQDNADAYIFLARIYSDLDFDGFDQEKSDSLYKKAAELYQKMAEDGDMYAQGMLANLYSDGNGVNEDQDVAAFWYERAAEQGEEFAQFKIGSCYENGEGVEQNYETAVKWYKLSAEQGNSDAQFSLGLCYKNGNGVEKNLDKAEYWLTQSAEQDNAEGQGFLALFYYGGESEDHDKAFYWALKAAKQGNPYAQLLVSKCYANGYGVEKNEESARFWRNLADENGVREK